MQESSSEIFDLQESEITRSGLFDMQVCVPEYWTDEQVKQFADLRNSCGTKNGWQIRREGNTLLGGMPERNPCTKRKGYVHITLDA